jgi:ATP-dependent Clp protease ATP-binding subunit ClpB
MTSNLGSDIIQKQHESDDHALMKNEVMQAVANHFRPEFINRVDDIVVFHSLAKDEIKKIAKIQLASLRMRLHELGYKLEISADALDKLAEAGFDPVYGARPLKRAIQVEIENPLAQALLEDKLGGGDKIRIGLDEVGQFSLT